MALNLYPLLENTLDGLGFELVEYERVGRGLLRVYIDKADVGINVEDCAQVSEHLSRVFFAHDIDYNRLEVSSPGWDRILRTETHFKRFIGETVSVTTHIPIDGRQRFSGVLENILTDNETDLPYLLIRTETEEAPYKLDWSAIKRARLNPQQTANTEAVLNKKPKQTANNAGRKNSR